MAEDLPGTQDIDGDCFSQSQSQPQSQPPEPQRTWGRLIPHKSSYNFTTLALNKDVYTFGRLETSDICVKDMFNNLKIEQVISKTHFKICHESFVYSNGIEDDVVYLEDESQNGTFINGILVGKGNKVMLVNNDLIAVARKSVAIYVYMSMHGYDSSLPDELKNKYAVSRTIGAGACGEVKMCFSKNGCTKYAMKLISKAKISDQKNPINDEKHILNEVSICKKLEHPCIIRIIDAVNTPQMVYIVLELMEGGELLERIKKHNGLSEQKAKFIFYQVVLAVHYLHENGITHRDLKPENILLASDDDETVVKVSDFGLSKIVDSQTMMKTFCGTPMYVAPEILLTGGRGTYTSQVDVWSLGVILYCCLSGLTPFSIHDRQHNLYEQIVKGMYNFNALKFSKVSLQAKDLITKMMTVDPLKRITIKKVLEHSWLKDENMLKKVEKVLGLNSNENRRTDNDNDINVPARFKRARLQ